MKIEIKINHNKFSKDSVKTFIVNAKSFYDAVYNFRISGGYDRFYFKNRNTAINYDWTIHLKRV